jgi:hypothetical protein
MSTLTISKVCKRYGIGYALISYNHGTAYGYDLVDRDRNILLTIEPCNYSNGDKCFLRYRFSSTPMIGYMKSLRELMRKCDGIKTGWTGFRLADKVQANFFESGVMTVGPFKGGSGIGIVGILIAVLLSGCSIQDEPKNQVMINSGIYSAEVIEVSKPVRLGDLIGYKGHSYLVVEIGGLTRFQTVKF